MNALVMPERQLLVFYGDQHVGFLGEQGDLWRFDYSLWWIESQESFDLSPALPRTARSIADGATQRPVQWFFDNLLPEEGARTLLAQEARIDQADAFGLLAYYGRESAGALTLVSPNDAGQQPFAIQPLPNKELSRRIRALPRHSLTHDAPKRMSMAGAQHKLPAVLLNGELFEPVGSAPSTVILKPDHVQTDHYPHSAANEWFCMALARAVGLSIPGVFLRYVPEPLYGVERFDRVGTWPNLRRRHVLDACQLLSLSNTFKYQQATVTTLSRIVDLCREKARTRVALYQWCIFNALIGNGDAHLKNLSFFVDANGIALAPHYDLLSTASYAAPGEWLNADMTFPMGEARKFGELRRAHALDFGKELGLAGDKLLTELHERISFAANVMLTQMAAGDMPIERAGEQRHVRLIVGGVLRDMLDQLA